jgi:Protein of unknown function (DUF3341)
MANATTQTLPRVGPEDGKPVLLLAEFETPATVMHAAEKLRDAGYTRFDTHTPFPVHGMDAAMGLKDSKLGWIVAIMATAGLTTAFSLITYANVIAYPFVVGGKPAFSLPSYAPVCFELTVLFSAFGAVFGMLGLNKLPQHNHPIFESDRFRAATDDKFFVSVEFDDPKFNEKTTRALLESAKATYIEIVEDHEP